MKHKQTEKILIFLTEKSHDVFLKKADEKRKGISFVILCFKDIFFPQEFLKTFIFLALCKVPDEDSGRCFLR